MRKKEFILLILLILLCLSSPKKRGKEGGGLKSVKDKRFFFAGREENMIKKGHDIFLNTKEKLKVRIHFHSPFLPNCMVAPNDGQCYWGKLTVTHELTV